MKRCLSGDADADERDDLGYTALHRAARDGALGAVLRLVVSGADIHARTEDAGRMTALELAMDSWAIPHWTKPAQGNPVPVDPFVYVDYSQLDANFAEIAVCLTREGANVRIMPLPQETVPLLGLDNGLLGLDYTERADAMAARLAQCEEETGRTDPGLEGTGVADAWGTPLHLAVYRGLPEQVADLVGAGADANAVDAFGLTPLFWASLHALDLSDYITDLLGPNTLQELFRGGADVNFRSPTGATPLMWAASWGTPDTEINALLRAGADQTLRDHAGRGMASYAEGRGAPYAVPHVAPGRALILLPRR